LTSNKAEPQRPVISQYWNTADVPGYVAELLATFGTLNPDFRHLVLDERAAERFIAERFGERRAAAFRACAVPSMQSDYFRYCTVLAHGGVYADADYRCLRPLRPLVEGCDGGEIFLGPTVHPLGGRQTRRVWSGFFAFRRPGHPFVELALELATANMEARIAERVWRPGEHVREAIWLTVGPGVPTLMCFIRDWGSFGAFVEGVAGSPAEPFAELYCETIGSYERLLEAFEGVRVSPNEAMFSWVGRPASPLPYKETEVHWHNVTSAIFR
jgi:hypothetical protein